MTHKCDQCEATLSSSWNLKRHLKKKHGMEQPPTPEPQSDTEVDEEPTPPPAPKQKVVRKKKEEETEPFDVDTLDKYIRQVVDSVLKTKPTTGQPVASNSKFSFVIPIVLLGAMLLVNSPIDTIVEFVKQSMEKKPPETATSTAADQSRIGRMWKGTESAFRYASSTGFLLKSMMVLINIDLFRLVFIL